MNYRSIVKLLANSTGMKWDMKTFSPYFNIKINGTDHQVGTRCLCSHKLPTSKTCLVYVPIIITAGHFLTIFLK